MHSRHMQKRRSRLQCWRPAHLLFQSRHLQSLRSGRCSPQPSTASGGSRKGPNRSTMVPSPAASARLPVDRRHRPVPLGDDLGALPASKQVAGHARALLVPRQSLQPLHRNARRPVDSPRALPGDCRRRICVLAKVRGNEHGGAEAGWANAAAETQPRVVDQNEATDGARRCSAWRKSTGWKAW